MPKEHSRATKRQSRATRVLERAPWRRVLSAALSAALLTLVSSCSEGGVTGLGETFDPAETVALLEGVSGAGQANISAAHTSLASDVLMDAIEASASSGPAHGLALLERVVRGSGIEGRADASTFATAVRAPVLSLHVAGAAAAAGASGALMPDTLMGLTFGLPDGIGGYDVVPGEDGAPVDGVRFLTYELDEVTGRPRRAPLKREGHLDIREETGGLPRLALSGTARDGRTDLDLYLEGEVTATQTELTSDFSSAGFVLEDDDPVEFVLQEHFFLTSDQLELSFSRQIEIPNRGHVVSLEWQGSAAAGEGGTTSAVSFALTVADAAHSARLDVTSDDLSVDGTVTYDGATAAIVSGDPLDPTLSRPDGSPFKPDDEEALWALFFGPDVVLSFGDEMLSALALLFES